MALKLFMVLVGCKPKGRHTEQHDVFFGIATSMKALMPQVLDFWPEADGDLHIDAWREVTRVGTQEINVVERNTAVEAQSHQLYFINLGGYKQNEFEEFHYKLLIASPDKSAAIKEAKQTAFFKHTHFEGAKSHIDDKYGVDVDDIYKIEDILSPLLKSTYSVVLTDCAEVTEDQLHMGYFKLNSF